MSVWPGGASVNQSPCPPSSKASLLQTGLFQVFPPTPQQGPRPSLFWRLHGGPPARLATASPCSPVPGGFVRPAELQGPPKCQGMNTAPPQPSRQDWCINAPAPLLPPCPRVTQKHAFCTGSQGVSRAGARRPPWPLACSHAL